MSLMVNKEIEFDYTRIRRIIEYLRYTSIMIKKMCLLSI